MREITFFFCLDCNAEIKIVAPVSVQFGEGGREMSYHFCSVETESIVFVTTQLRRDRKEMNLFLLVCNAEMEKCIASVYTQFGGGGGTELPLLQH